MCLIYLSNIQVYAFYYTHEKKYKMCHDRFVFLCVPIVWAGCNFIYFAFEMLVRFIFYYNNERGEKGENLDERAREKRKNSNSPFIIAHTISKRAIIILECFCRGKRRSSRNATCKQKYLLIATKNFRCTFFIHLSCRHHAFALVGSPVLLLSRSHVRPRCVRFRVLFNFRL